MKTSSPQAAMSRWLHARTHVLVLSHERPDGDALGSLFALRTILRATGKTASLYLRAPLPQRYRALFADEPEILTGDAGIPAGVDSVLCLDVAEWPRVDAPPAWRAAPPGLPTAVIDHHRGQPGFGDLHWVDSTQAATAQMLALLARAGAFPLPPAAASALLVGLVMDTGGFRFPNTDAAVLRAAAELIEAGADFDAVMHALFMSEPHGRLRLQAQVIAAARFAFAGRLVYTVLTAPMVEATGAEPADTEGLIDALKTVAGIEVACLLHVEDDGVRFSFRSHRADRPVDGMARRLGGGGHLLAAGARVQGIDAATAESMLLELFREGIRDE